MSTPLDSTSSGKTAIATVSYTHDAMIDLILANPKITQNAIAAHFGYTAGWVSRVMGSDAFNARLAERKGELIDPTIVASMEERVRGLAIQSLDVIHRKLDATQSPELAVKSLELSVKALGMGARIGQQNNVQNNFVVALPQKAENEKDWAAQAQAEAKKLSTPRPADVEDVEPKG